MKGKILGSGGWDGIPAPFCKCSVCQEAMATPSSKNYRTRPQILISSNRRQFLLEISPDIRLQSVKENLTDIQTFFVSHWHWDHLGGLWDLHAWAEYEKLGNIQIFGSEFTIKKINDTFSHIPKNLNILKPFETIKIDEISITALPLYHSYKKDKNLNENELCHTFGYLLQDKFHKVVYLADYYKIPLQTIKYIHNCDVIIVDGTYLFEELFPDSFAIQDLKTDLDHLHGKKIIKYLESLNISAKKIIFHSITHLSQRKHDELEKLLPNDNYMISYDGLEFIDKKV
jgi:phosphoribosyl 1,2-cyclic phosphate phosphodiesterase